MTGLAALPGVAVGLAAACTLAALARPAPLDLTETLHRLISTTTSAHVPDRSDAGRRNRATVERLLERPAQRMQRSPNRWWGIPARDLAILDVSPARYLARRLTWAAGAACFAVLLVAAATIGGLAPTAVIAALAVVAAILAGQSVPVLAVAEDAEARREEFRRAVAAYLDLVAQERASGAAPAQALSDAVQVADSLPFRRIDAALRRAERAGITPWSALADLGARVGVPELGDLADIAASAADGAAVYTTLTSKAAGMRRAALAADRARANANSQRLALPVTVLLLAFLLLVLYPAVVRLLTT